MCSAQARCAPRQRNCVISRLRRISIIKAHCSICTSIVATNASAGYHDGLHLAPCLQSSAMCGSELGSLHPGQRRHGHIRLHHQIQEQVHHHGALQGHAKAGAVRITVAAIARPRAALLTVFRAVLKGSATCTCRCAAVGVQAASMKIACGSGARAMSHPFWASVSASVGLQQ